MRDINYPIEHYSFLKRFLLNLTKPSWSIDTSHFVPSDQHQFLNHKAIRLGILFKYFRRWLYFKFKGHDRYLVNRIDGNVKRILWINLSAASIGDVLMDLSGRVLLKQYAIDMLAQTKASELFAEDLYFKKVYKSSEAAKSSHEQHPYDLIIVDSFSPRILTVKNMIAPKTPFVGMWGFLNGFEVHRTLYSFERIRRLLSDQPAGLKGLLRPTITLIHHRPKDFSVKDLVKIGFAIGGEWDSRKYDKWHQVVTALDEIACEIYLLGSENGKAEASFIADQAPRVQNYVGKLSLNETAEIISDLDCFVAADGGLWHIACALDKPSVTLFSGVFIYDHDGKRVLRDTGDIDCIAFHDEHAVSNIEVSLVVSAIKQQIRKIKRDSSDKI